MTPEELSFPVLGPMRDRVAEVLMAESAKPFGTATLRVSPSHAAEVIANTRLHAGPAAAARDLYAGSLYRALDLTSLRGAARRRSGQWIVITSPLYGALRPDDRVAPYLLSMNTPLPLLAPLAARWRGPLSQALPTAAGTGLLIDCRAGAYAAAWQPRGAMGARWVRVRVSGGSAQAKHTHGLLVRRLIVDGVDARAPQDLAGYLAGYFEVSLTRRDRGAREWLLDIAPSADPEAGTRLDAEFTPSAGDSDRSGTPPAPRHLTTV